MTPGLLWLLIVWGALTVVLIILLIYRSTLTMQEDDQLFLDDSASAMAKDQQELMAKVNKITPVVKMLGAASGVMVASVPWQLRSSEGAEDDDFDGPVVGSVRRGPR